MQCFASIICYLYTLFFLSRTGRSREKKQQLRLDEYIFVHNDFGAKALVRQIVGEPNANNNNIGSDDDDEIMMIILMVIKCGDNVMVMKMIIMEMIMRMVIMMLLIPLRW